MTLARHLLAVVLIAVAVGPVIVGARAAAARIVPSWPRPPRAIVASVVALAMVVGVGELFGAVGLFELVPMVLGLAGVGALAWWLTRTPEVSSPVQEAQEAPYERSGVMSLYAAVVATAVVTADWASQAIAALHHGMRTSDTLWYHLPVAARFFQTGSVTALHYVDGDSLTAFFPARASVLHGFGMLLTDNDFLSPLMNVGFLVLALAAAWCIGRPFGVAPLTLMGACVVLATPMIVATQPGSGYSDMPGAALLLAAIAILVAAGAEGRLHARGPLVIAALASGLTLGMKFQFIVPVVALTVVVIALAPRGERVRAGVPWVLTTGLAGCFWYVRSWIEVGNPLPLVDLGPLQAAHVRTPSFTVAEYVFDRRIWDDFFLPGMEQAFGPAWWALLLIAASAIVLVVITGRSTLHRALALVSVAALVGYVVTPAALGFKGSPIFFVFTLRYTFFGLLLALIVLPLARVVEGRTPWVVGAFAVVLLVTQLDPAIWPSELRDARFDQPIGGSDAIVAALIGAVVLIVGFARLARRDRPVWRPSLAVVVASGLVLVGGWFALERFYLDGRYRNTEPLPVAYRWARGVHDARIAIVGNWLQYPLAGKDLSNHVQYIGVRGDHGSFRPAETCREWREAVNAGDYTYVLTAPNPAFLDDTPIEEKWTRTDPAISLVLRDRGAVLWRIRGNLDPDSCRDSS